MVVYLHKDYQRLSISKLKPEFVGWDYYIALIEQIPSLKSSDVPRDQAFFSVMLETGCRIREILGKRNERKEFVSPPLMRSNFLFTKLDRLIITDIPILKRYEKLDHTTTLEDAIPDNVSPAHRKLWHKNKEGKFERKYWETKRLLHTRRIEIPSDEPLLEYAIPYIKDSDGVLFNLSYDYYYAMCRRMDPLKGKYPKVPPHIFPHWWRSQRACQLASEYKFSLHELLDFFDWKDVKMGKMYASLAGTLGDKMSRTKTIWRNKPSKTSTKQKKTKEIPEIPQKISKIIEPTKTDTDEELKEFEEQMEKEGEI